MSRLIPINTNLIPVVPVTANKTTIADLVAAAHDANRIGFQLADQRAREEAATAEAAVKRLKRAKTSWTSVNVARSAS